MSFECHLLHAVVLGYVCLGQQVTSSARLMHQCAFNRALLDYLIISFEDDPFLEILMREYYTSWYGLAAASASSETTDKSTQVFYVNVTPQSVFPRNRQ